MGNEQLRQALRNAGLEVDDLAVKAEVDVKTVRRWVAGRTPRARYRRRVADALGVPERVLWPDEVPDQEQPADDGTEAFELLVARSAPDWRELLTDACERAWLLDLTLGDVLADGDGRLLADAARRGCQVRVLISDPDSVHLAIAEQDAGRHVNLAHRPASVRELDRVFKLLAPHAERGAVEVRRFVDAGAYQVLVFDDQALIRLRLSGVVADASPVLYLSRDGSGEVFDGFTEHFQTIWQRSEALG